MHRLIWITGVGSVVALAVLLSSPSAPEPVVAKDAAKDPVRKASGLEKREQWTTSKVKGSPEPPDPYQMMKAYQKVTFTEPLELIPVPGQKAWIVAERHGKIYTFDADPAKAEKKLVLDVGHTVYGIALHPKFQQNGLIYVSNVPNTDKETQDGSRISRYEVKDRAKMEADKKSEQVVMTWPSGGHNGGCLRFGPDGYLYLSTGDGSGIADSKETGQDLSTVLGKILRIDVDKTQDGKNYAIPKDNPFAEMKGARGENWAYGIRQSWKISFDTKTGDLWAGEVGQDLWESVYKIQKGGNYGWSVSEGSHPFRPERKKGPTPILSPIVEHNHTEFRSLTGGYIYHGTKFPELKDAYVYGDFDTGRVWMLRASDQFSVTLEAGFEPEKKLELILIVRQNTGLGLKEAKDLVESPPQLVKKGLDRTAAEKLQKQIVEAGAKATIRNNSKGTEHRELAKSTLRIVAWGQDHDGEMFALDFVSGGLYQLAVVPPKAKDPVAFPRKLSETGLFASTKDLTPEKGLIPYSVNAELWSDGATKERFIAIPGTAKIEYETVTYPQPAPGSLPGWRFPNDTVLVKTFFLETEPGKKRRLETRLLHVRIVGGTEEYGDQVWNGYTYIWNDEQTDAELADIKGVDRTFKIKTAAGEREQKWHFPSRTECNMCHTVTAKYALGVNTQQMNRDHDYGGVVANQLATLEHIGLFDRKLPATPDKLAKIADFRDPKASVDDRARAYLHANCSHCHRKWGGGNAEFQLLANLPLKETGTIDIKPGQGTLDLKDPRLLIPGEPDRSLIYYRMTRLGLGRMPHIASNVVDEDAVKLISDWIKMMPK